VNALALLSPDLLDAIEALIAERVAEALAAQPVGSPWLTLDQAADYSHLSARTLARLVASGELRSACVGRRRIVHRADLDALLDGRK
jgi:excisionase family DNA binding protein